MMGAETRFRAKERCPGDALAQQQRNDFMAEKIVLRNRIFVKMNRDFLGWTGDEHALSSFRAFGRNHSPGTCLNPAR